MCAVIDRQEVHRIAALARVGLTGDELQRYAQELREILAYAEMIQRADLPDAALPFHVLPPASANRDDTVVPSLDRPDALAGAPEISVDGSLFKVPRVIGE